MTDHILDLRRLCYRKLSALVRRTDLVLAAHEETLDPVTVGRVRDQQLQIAMRSEQLPPFQVVEADSMIFLMRVIFAPSVSALENEHGESRGIAANTLTTSLGGSINEKRIFEIEFGRFDCDNEEDRIVLEAYLGILGLKHDEVWQYARTLDLSDITEDELNSLREYFASKTRSTPSNVE